ncbi:MAG: hypothetical protein Ct9H300mP14_05620 [Gammaproteobacteria bacterium]|nr:MAG: hypothetical protein Ct9H300mP14_05620 [Gammaproteobacteria bacterium]
MRRLIELEPDNAHAYNALGYTLADQTDRLDEALVLIERALVLLPEDPFILDSMGWVHYRLGNNDLAREYLQKAIDLRLDAEIAAHLGEVLWMEMGSVIRRGQYGNAGMKMTRIIQYCGRRCGSSNRER